MVWDDPEERKNKKINRVARNGAYSVGGGVGLWFMNALYPYEESAEKIASLFGYIAATLMVYGVIALATVMFKRNLAVPVNMLMVWLILPAVIFWIFGKFWVG